MVGQEFTRDKDPAECKVERKEERDGGKDQHQGREKGKSGTREFSEGFK